MPPTWTKGGTETEKSDKGGGGGGCQRDREGGEGDRRKCRGL